MSYSTTNPAKTILSLGFASAGSILMYDSSHASTDITAASFFAGCGFGSPSSAGGGTSPVGMRVGDLLVNVNNQTNAVTWHRVTSISTSTGYGSLLHATVGAGSS